MARVLMPRLMVNAYATFLVDTGSDLSTKPRGSVSI